MLEAQGGVCYLCEQERKLVIDHDHSTKRVRGLLCVPCNAFLGWYERPGMKARIKRYLKGEL